MVAMMAERQTACHFLSWGEGDGAVVTATSTALAMVSTVRHIASVSADRDARRAARRSEAPMLKDGRDGGEIGGRGRAGRLKKPARDEGKLVMLAMVFWIL
jgi:hypothetical protein